MNYKIVHNQPPHYPILLICESIPHDVTITSCGTNTLGHMVIDVDCNGDDSQSYPEDATPSVDGEGRDLVMYQDDDLDWYSVPFTDCLILFENGTSIPLTPEIWNGSQPIPFPPE